MWRWIKNLILASQKTGGNVAAKAKPIPVMTLRVYRVATNKWEDVK